MSRCCQKACQDCHKVCTSVATRQLRQAARSRSPTSKLFVLSLPLTYFSVLARRHTARTKPCTRKNRSESNKTWCNIRRSMPECRGQHRIITKVIPSTMEHRATKGDGERSRPSPECMPGGRSKIPSPVSILHKLSGISAELSLKALRTFHPCGPDSLKPWPLTTDTRAAACQLETATRFLA